MEPRRKLVGTFIGHLYDYAEDGTITTVTEINTDLSNITTDHAALWFSRGSMILGVLDWAVVASDAFIDGLAGRTVVLEVPVNAAFESIYTLPSEAKTG